jgi:sulfofructosephosphate aldolase
VQYPGSEQACRVLHEACGAVPWVLLGGGEDAATLERQVEDACRAGASGVIVGRTVWDAALLANGEESARQVTDTSRPILRRLRQIVEAAARPVPQPAA